MSSQPRQSQGAVPPIASSASLARSATRSQTRTRRRAWGEREPGPIPKAAEVHPPTAWAPVVPGVSRWSYVGTSDENYPFLRSLRLRNILLLSPEPPTPELLLLAEEQRTTITHFHLAPEPDVIPPGGGWNWNTLSDAATLPARLSTAPDEPVSDVPNAPGVESFMSPVDHDPFIDEVPQTQLIDPLSIFWSGANIVNSIISSKTIKKALEALVDIRNHPMAIVDVSGVHEVGVVVGCLRKLQRWNFASILIEYRTFGGSRVRPEHERFIETFDIDSLTLPAEAYIPRWVLYRPTPKVPTRPT